MILFKDMITFTSKFEAEERRSLRKCDKDTRKDECN